MKAGAVNCETRKKMLSSEREYLKGASGKYHNWTDSILEYNWVKIRSNTAPILVSILTLAAKPFLTIPVKL